MLHITVCVCVYGSFHFFTMLADWEWTDISGLSYSSRDARVVKDMTTGKSKGYGFVSFYNKLVRLQLRNTKWRLFPFLFIIFIMTHFQFYSNLNDHLIMLSAFEMEII